MSEKIECPICKTSDAEKNSDREEIFIDCPRCGNMKFSATFFVSLSSVILSINSKYPKNSYLLSHALRKYFNSSSEIVDINTEFIDNAINTFELPNIIEQSNNLINLLGEESFYYSDILELSLDYCMAMIGCCDEDELLYLQKHLLEKNYILIPEENDDILDLDLPSPAMGLGFEGWEKYNEFKVRDEESRYAFMAMDYNDEMLNDICENYFKKAVEKTGFELRLLRDKPKAGIIDNQLRVAIRRARFLIADLTHDNNGAYWEAGYAEGLGKHVIYLCEKNKFKEKKTHFDTNHCTTIPWDKDNPDEACEELKATIRNTFYIESKQEQ